jgi:putative toxin-antitoxin system antitoxin component (TIGR02293 family)
MQLHEQTPARIGVALTRLLADSRYAEIYQASPMEYVAGVRAGIPAREVGHLADELGTSRDKLYKWLGMARQTVTRKVKADAMLSPQDGERLLGVARLVGQVQTMVNESGDPQGFDAAAWVADWLVTPNAALGGQMPSELMDTHAGQGLVSQLLAQAQSGAYA